MLFSLDGALDTPPIGGLGQVGCLLFHKAPSTIPRCSGTKSCNGPISAFSCPYGCLGNAEFFKFPHTLETVGFFKLYGSEVRGFSS